ncbi:hypothetical protein KIW84_043947 [Lathyrus oleraceus]|uniref:CCHC-type domain-containing protein n=1 Tax=Pisum sativum TaxID=3888 RepID=A0A9D4XFA2_PEA|nr:hypothetical protein KIW84_043947 [Pisum sativum]
MTRRDASCCKKPGHFIGNCPGLQKDKSKKGSYHKDNFRNKVKKSFMATWNELDTLKDGGSEATKPSEAEYPKVDTPEASPTSEAHLEEEASDEAHDGSQEAT